MLHTDYGNVEVKTKDLYSAPHYAVAVEQEILKMKDLDSPSEESTGESDAYLEKIPEPPSERDAARRALALIKLRQGQPKFRNALILAYNGRCAITGFDAIPALEAAHIVPHTGGHSDVITNGILLRADIHTLFDEEHIKIHPKTLKVVLSAKLKKTDYKPLNGTRIAVPHKASDRPSREALEHRWSGQWSLCGFLSISSRCHAEHAGLNSSGGILPERPSSPVKRKSS